MTATAVTSTLYPDLCMCPRCLARLADAADGVVCSGCGATYPVVNGVLRLLTNYEDVERQRYLENYEQIARADLEEPFEYNRRERHDVLLRFIGDVRGKRVLDIGSSDAGYLSLIHI